MWWILTAAAATFTIPTDYATIAAAVESGELLSGDTLRLQPGEHRGYDFIGSGLTDLTVEGEGPLSVIVPADEPVSVLRFEGAVVAVRDLTIDGQGFARGLEMRNSTYSINHVNIRNGLAGSRGGGLLHTLESTGDVSNLYIFGSDANRGGGIAVNGGSFIGDGITLDNNTAVRGGGIHVSESGTVSLAYSLIKHGSATSGAGAYLEGASDISDTVFLNNIASSTGGGINGDQGAMVDLNWVQLVDNQANEGGGIWGNLALNVQATLFQANLASKGGGIYLAGTAPPATFDNVAFCDNQASDGAAVFTSIGSASTFQNALFLGAPNDHVLLRAEGDITVLQALFHDPLNVYALESTGSLVVQRSVFTGGGITATEVGSNTVENSTHPNTSLAGVDDPQFLVVDPTIVGSLCTPGLGFPYPNNVEFVDATTSGFTDLDGSIADVGHLGGSVLDPSFWGADLDGDNSLAHLDCDDTNPHVNPNVPEQCDGQDTNCDGLIDNGGLTVYLDIDGDGIGDGPSMNGCPGPSYVLVDGDCNDDDPTVFPGAPDNTCDGVDNNCDNDTDEDAPTTIFYADNDQDSYGDPAISVAECIQPHGFVTNNSDCNDDDAGFNPGAQEQCDTLDWNCNLDFNDGVVNLDWYFDGDGDGWGSGSPISDCASPGAHYVLRDGDCASNNNAVHPAAEEICDGIDNDCDNDIDDDDSVVTGAPTWYTDADNDSFGDATTAVISCTQPAHTVGRALDCDDQNPNIYVGAPEACEDGLDNDCDQLIDTLDPDFTFDQAEYANDADGDGYGDPNSLLAACSGDQPPGYVSFDVGADCNDNANEINPGAIEICDGIDNDCANGSDDGLVFQDYFIDADGDLFGDPSSAPITSCIALPNRSGNALDCDDTDVHRNPTAQEICNEIDDNCQNGIDEGLPTENYYPDIDADGFGDATAAATTSCAPVGDQILNNTDCNDADSTIYPAAPEIDDDGIDSDCDGVVEHIPRVIEDLDGDSIPDNIDPAPNSAGSAPSMVPAPADYGCGCSSSGGLPGALLGLVVLFAARRRN